MLSNVFPRIMNFLPGPQHTLFSKWEKLNTFIASVIENHERDWNPVEPRDFTDAAGNRKDKKCLYNFIQG